MLEIVCL